MILKVELMFGSFHLILHQVPLALPLAPEQAPLQFDQR